MAFLFADDDWNAFMLTSMAAALLNMTRCHLIIGSFSLFRLPSWFYCWVAHFLNNLREILKQPLIYIKKCRFQPIKTHIVIFYWFILRFSIWWVLVVFCCSSKVVFILCLFSSLLFLISLSSSGNCGQRMEVWFHLFICEIIKTIVAGLYVMAGND